MAIIDIPFNHSYSIVDGAVSTTVDMTFSAGGRPANFGSIKAALAILFGVDTSEITLAVKSTPPSDGTTPSGQAVIGCTVKASTENDAKRVIEMIKSSSFVKDCNDELKQTTMQKIVLDSAPEPTCEGCSK